MIALTSEESRRMFQERQSKPLPASLNEDAELLSAAQVLMHLGEESSQLRVYNNKSRSLPSMPYRASLPVETIPKTIGFAPSCVTSASEASLGEESADDSSIWSEDVENPHASSTASFSIVPTTPPKIPGNVSTGSSVEHFYFAGSVSLALKEDPDSLSPLHCFMRQYCVEAFAANAEDVATPRHGRSLTGRVVEGQVGIRCIHCKHRPPTQRQERATCFPSSIQNIYHSIETWQRRHSIVCQDIPVWVKSSLLMLMKESKTGAGGRRKYWEDSARRIGMANTERGIRFVRVPGDMGPLEDDSVSLPSTTNLSAKSYPVVYEHDKPLVTEYLFTLVDQMELCNFTEEDRLGGRSKVKDCPMGFPGMQCKHCRGRAGFGRYYPTTLQALTSANTDRNMFNHLMKCRRCPTEVQQQLSALRSEHQETKNRRGSRKTLFERVWRRLHANDDTHIMSCQPVHNHFNQS